MFIARFTLTVAASDIHPSPLPSLTPGLDPAIHLHANKMDRRVKLAGGAQKVGHCFMDAQHPLLSVDCVVFDPGGRLLLIRRKHPPFQGQYALPGGFVEYGETTEMAAARELAEETGLVATDISLIGVYSDPHRDPRGHAVSIAYRITVAGYDPRAGDDAADAVFVTDWEERDLAFDHRKIVDDALRKGPNPT